jgi:hypothetical protein
MTEMAEMAEIPDRTADSATLEPVTGGPPNRRIIDPAPVLALANR